MKILLLLNGPIGCQTGIEDGFSHLLRVGKLGALKWIYFNEVIANLGPEKAFSSMLDAANALQPDVVVLFHIGKTPITVDFLGKLRRLNSKPTLVYDEGDMYGGWAKPLPRNVESVIAASDVVSIRGLGRFYDQVSRLNKNIIYTPHHADIARFDFEPHILQERDNELVFIGNSVRPRALGWIRRMSGAAGRERFVRHIGKTFPGRFALYGAGWDGFAGNRGPIEFDKQLHVYKNSWITLAYEHYPEIPYYFSNRLPIALLAGSLYICHFHGGYDKQFKSCDFIHFYRTNDEATEIINYIRSLSRQDLLERSHRAREHAMRYYLPAVVWGNFLNNAIAQSHGYGS